MDISRHWPAIKKILAIIFIIHLAWFLFFIINKIAGSDSLLPDLSKKLWLGVIVIIIVIFVYNIWVHRIKWVNKIISFCISFFLIVYLFSLLWFFYCTFFNPPITITQTVSIIQGNGLKRNYIPFSQMSPYIKLAVLSSEDQLFTDHDGFDLKAIKRAIKYNQKHPNRARGASTISQQTAKNIFLWQGGGFIRKGIEVFYTFSIEKLWGKKIILERYLNIAEMGKGIFGVQAAAKFYFNKNAKDLTRAEAAQIAACLPNPKKYAVKPLSKYVANRYDDIMRQMQLLGPDPDIQNLIR